MKIFISLMVIGTLLFTGCAYESRYHIPMAPQVEKMEITKTIPLEAALLITEESRDRIFKSLSFPDYHGNFIIYSIEPYQLPIGQAFEKAALQVFSQFFPKIHLIRNLDEAKNYQLVIEPRLTDFYLTLFYTNFGRYIYNEVVDGRCRVKVTGTLFSREKVIWEKTIETPLAIEHWVNNYWLKDSVGKLASDTLVLALKIMAFQIVRESQLPPSPPRGWLEEIGEKK